jgi:hypothetical protein
VLRTNPTSLTYLRALTTADEDILFNYVHSQNLRSKNLLNNSTGPSRSSEAAQEVKTHNVKIIILYHEVMPLKGNFFGPLRSHRPKESIFKTCCAMSHSSHAFLRVASFSEPGLLRRPTLTHLCLRLIAAYVTNEVLDVTVPRVTKIRSVCTVANNYIARMIQNM